MKIEHLEETLKELKEEDLGIKFEIEKEIYSLNKRISEIEKDIRDINRKIEIDEYIFKIRSNIFKNLCLCAPFAEFILIVALTCVITFAEISLGIFFITILLDFMLVGDFTLHIVNILGEMENTYPNKFITVIKRIFMKKELLINSILNNKQLLENKKEELSEVSDALTDNKRKHDDIDDELCVIDGNLMGVTYLRTKRFLDEIADEQEVVEFVNRRLELKPIR